MDKCGHTTNNVVAAVERSFTKVKKIHTEAKILAIEGDNGGGGAVSKTHHGLVQAGVMEASTRYINCLVHALNKCIE